MFKGLHSPTHKSIRKVTQLSVNKQYNQITNASISITYSYKPLSINQPIIILHFKGHPMPLYNLIWKHKIPQYDLTHEDRQRQSKLNIKNYNVHGELTVCNYQRVTCHSSFMNIEVTETVFLLDRHKTALAGKMHFQKYVLQQNAQLKLWLWSCHRCSIKQASLWPLWGRPWWKIKLHSESLGTISHHLGATNEYSCL